MKKIDRFILREMLSDGPAGTVYKADEILPGEILRAVALKVLPIMQAGDQLALDRFFGEVRVLAQLAVQPNVATIYSVGITDGYPWLAMEFAPATAEEHIFEEAAQASDVERLLIQVGRGLLAMHSLQPPLVHQDLKPANILIDPFGNYKITDFSMASAISANRTHGLATVRYAAPEMLSSEFGKVGPATDLYALGHIAYQMALGNRLHRQQFKAVFEGNSTKEPPPNKWMMWHASANTKPAPLTDVRRDFPPHLAQVIERLMTKPLAQRCPSAQELLSDLGKIDSRPAPAAPASQSAAPPPPAPASPPPPPEPAGNFPSTPRVPAARPPQNPATAQRYWVRLRGRVTGPFDAATLQRQIRQGQLSRLHQVSTDQTIWKAAAEIEALYGPTVV